MKVALDSLYTSFNFPESALDPIQIVRRYEALDDREVVAFIAAGLAFGRVASVMASIEAVGAVLGPRPAAFVRRFDPNRDGADLRRLVHRWTRGDDFVGLIWILHELTGRDGSLERTFASALDPSAADVEAALEAFSARARDVDLRPAYGRRPRTPGAHYFFSRPSTGSACKRLNLFLRWMVRRDAVDPGGWTSVPTRQLVVPLDTHTIRMGKCLRLTRRTTPGWKMAAEITAALRAYDADDPVRYDFALCHLSMMGACGFGTSRGSAQCPLHDHCRPRRAPRTRRRGR
ncbi:MAG TPA: TIGR02757 family protein [Vicinamibacterales bacterium]|nr:TIGR02757 family protein [Vicinamibacterales bacterium]